MPYKDPEAHREAVRRSYAKNKKRIQLARHLAYQKRREELRKVHEAANRKRGHKPRPKGEKARKEIKVTASKLYRFFEGRIYFTSLKGFTPSEVRAILALHKEHVATGL